MCNKFVKCGVALEDKSLMTVCKRLFCMSVMIALVENLHIQHSNLIYLILSLRIAFHFNFVYVHPCYMLWPSSELYIRPQFERHYHINSFIYLSSIKPYTWNLMAFICSLSSWCCVLFSFPEFFYIIFDLYVLLILAIDDKTYLYATLYVVNANAFLICVPILLWYCV